MFATEVELWRRMKSRNQKDQHEGKLVGVDIETGGLEFRRPIIQIAAVALDAAMNELEQFEVKIQFDEQKACKDSLRRIHYQRAEWRRSAVAPRKAAWDFARFLRRHATVRQYGTNGEMFKVAQLVAHNSGFDGPFLQAWYKKLGIFFPASYRYQCTLQRAYWLFAENPELPQPDDFRLLTLCRYFDVPFNAIESHEALADVRAMIAMYRAMRELESSKKGINARQAG